MYIVVHICIYCTIVKIKKIKKKPFWTYFLWEVVAYGTELIPLFPYLRAGLFLREKKGGGGGGARSTLTVSTPDNRMMIFDHSLKGVDYKIYPGFNGNSYYF